MNRLPLEDECGAPPLVKFVEHYPTIAGERLRAGEFVTIRGGKAYRAAPLSVTLLPLSVIRGTLRTVWHYFGDTSPTPEAHKRAITLRMVRENAEQRRRSYLLNHKPHTLPIYRPRSHVINEQQWGKPLIHTCPMCGESGPIHQRMDAEGIITGMKDYMLGEITFMPCVDHRCDACRTRLLVQITIRERCFALMIATYESETS